MEILHVLKLIIVLAFHTTDNLQTAITWQKFIAEYVKIVKFIKLIRYESLMHHSI